MVQLSAAAVTQREICRATRLAPALPALAGGPNGKGVQIGTELLSSAVWSGPQGISADVEEEFFGSYSSYLRVDVLAASPAAHRRWLGLAEASIARLLRKLERLPDLSLRPLPRCFHTVDGRPNSRWQCTAFFIGVMVTTQAICLVLGIDGVRMFERLLLFTTAARGCFGACEAEGSAGAG